MSESFLPFYNHHKSINSDKKFVAEFISPVLQLPQIDRFLPYFSKSRLIFHTPTTTTVPVDYYYCTRRLLLLYRCTRPQYMIKSWTPKASEFPFPTLHLQLYPPKLHDLIEDAECVRASIPNIAFTTVLVPQYMNKSRMPKAFERPFPT